MSLDERYCPHCNSRIGPQGGFCSACGRPILNTGTRDPDGHAIRWAVAICFAMIFVLWLLGQVLAPQSEASRRIDERARVREQLTSEAKSICQGFVRKRLVAPSTSDFGDDREVTTSVSDQGNWIVSGWLESHNRLGVPLREIYACEMERRADDWRLVDIQVGAQ